MTKQYPPEVVKEAEVILASISGRRSDRDLDLASVCKRLTMFSQQANATLAAELERLRNLRDSILVSPRD